MSRDHPSPAVLRAFGAGGPARRLTGGQGSSWAAGEVVLKPDGGGLHEWLGEAFAGVACEGFRLAAPVRARDGAWSVRGWSATRRVRGAAPDYSAAPTWPEILAAGRAFHRAVAHLGRPAFLDTRRDWWAEADRAAWAERTVRFVPEFAALARRLEGALLPLGPSQLVHADLTGNVLFAPGLPPAIIDISPYWRPPPYADGVVVADALCWHDAPSSLAEAAGVPVAAVARALLFRMATTNERVLSGGGGVDVRDEARRYARAAAAIGL
ncbi:TIGR02569 family protein [Actinoplanes sp. NPDC023714]|uniref:TIGR02569 family protein n=1 Tax=Actinoplanes sp. NPDC023714 TaxID=3154322 RepID=UPI0033D1FC57